jgi:hypothetical protein
MSDVPDPSLTPARERSPALVVSGALMIATGLLLANPDGATDTRWPWQILADWPWERRDANWALWFSSAVLAIVLGLVGTRRVRAPLLFGAALLLFVTCCSRDAGLAVGRYNIAWFAGLALLVAGFLLESEGRWRAAARGCCALGALLTLWTLTLSFDRDALGAPEWRFAKLVDHVFTRVRGLGVPDAPADYDIDLFANFAAVLAAVVGLGNLVGLRGGIVARIGLVLVLLHYLVPTFHRLGVQLGGNVERGDVFRTLSEVLIQYGLAVSLFAATATADFARLQTRPA